MMKLENQSYNFWNESHPNRVQRKGFYRSFWEQVYGVDWGAKIPYYSILYSKEILVHLIHSILLVLNKL
jgi:hypothetical protein